MRRVGGKVEYVLVGRCGLYRVYLEFLLELFVIVCSSVWCSDAECAVVRVRGGTLAHYVAGVLLGGCSCVDVCVNGVVN